MKSYKGVVLDAGTLNFENTDWQPIQQLPIDWCFYDNTEPQDVFQRIKDIDFILTNKVSLQSGHLTNKNSYIGVLATGMDKIDLEHCKKLNIEVKNVANYSTDSVAQHTIALMLNLSMNLLQYSPDNLIKWSESSMFCRLDYPIFELKNKILGLIGAGNIGLKVKSLAEAFGMRVLLAETVMSSRRQKNRTAMHELFEKSDFISLHCPLTEQTKNLIDLKKIKLMKPTSFIINTSRGPIINESDLAYALNNELIAGAALDVLENEPPLKTSPLMSIQKEKLITTPHTAWASIEARRRLIQITAENIKNHLKLK